MKTLSKEHSYVQITQNPPNVWSITDTAGSAELLTPGGFVVSKNYFDLAGLTMREKTLFFKSAFVQDFLNPSHTTGAAGDSLILIDLMTSSPLSDAELSGFAVNGNFAGLTSGLTSGLTFDQTIYGRVRQYVVDLDTAAWGSFIQVSDNQLGSMSPTASDRVYSYRMFFPGTPTTAASITVLGARHILSADVKEEAEFEYLMRLKRSYELQQSYDED